MKVTILPNKLALGQAAASEGAKHINAAIAEKGSANVILATGASQFEMMASLVDELVDWSIVTFFHLDEYIGLPQTHPASFRKYLKGRFANQVPLKTFHFIDGEADPDTECARLNQLMADHPIDVAFV
ncbi:MAG: 6-phosphogluconolactonase, partial [Cyclobacteriaceae bacterium]